MDRKKYVRNQKLIYARELRGWSQKDLANKLAPQVDTSTISRWERGVMVPAPFYRQQLAEAFQMSVLELGLLPADRREELPSLSPEGSKSASKAFYNIPRLLTPLFGRDLEIGMIRSFLLQPEIQLVTLLGSGGVGKTRVGIEIASQMRQDFPDGLCFVSLAAVCDPDLVGPVLAKELKIDEAETRPLIEQIKTYFSQKHFLLLLDNFEHVVEAALFIEELLDACPFLKVIVTSREALHLRSEQRFPLHPLPLPDLHHLPPYEDLIQSPVVLLFAQHARAHKPTFEIHSRNVHDIIKLCTCLDGLPLAIELAASHIEHLSLQTLITHTPTYLYYLKNRKRKTPSRQQTLVDTIQWSYNLLSPQEQWLFRQLALFKGGVSLSELEAFLAINKQSTVSSLLENIISLCEKSLLISQEMENAETRFVMLETIRHYGIDALQAENELVRGQRSYALFYLSLVEQIAPSLFGDQQVSGLQQLELELDNIRMALNWLIEQRESLLALRFCEAFGKFCGLQGYWNEERRWLKRILELPSSLEGNAIRARVFRRAGHLAYRFRDLSEAEKLQKESIALARELQDWYTLAGALSGLGWVLYRQNDKAATQDLLQESITMAHKSGSNWSLANALESFGRFLFLGERVDEAAVFLAEGVAISRNTLDKECLARSLTTLISIELAQGKIQQAALYGEESFLLAQELGTKPLIALVESRLGDIAFHQKAYAQAKIHFEASLSLAYDLSDEVAVASRQQKLVELSLLCHT